MQSYVHELGQQGQLTGKRLVRGFRTMVTERGRCILLEKKKEKKEVYQIDNTSETTQFASKDECCHGFILIETFTKPIDVNRSHQ